MGIVRSVFRHLRKVNPARSWAPVRSGMDGQPLGIKTSAFRQFSPDRRCSGARSGDEKLDIK